MSTPAETVLEPETGTRELTYREAIRLAMEHEMESDPTVLLLGEDVGDPGGPFKTSEGLIAKFGPNRILDTPIAENCFVGVGIGLAVTGFRPVIEIMFADFLGVAMDAVVNEAAKYRFMSGGKFAVPITIRAIGGGTGRFGAQHSQTAESWFAGIAGLKVVAAATPADAYGLLRSAIRDPNPVLFLEHKGLYVRKGQVTPTEMGRIPLDAARVVRPGADVTLVGTLLMVERCVAAAEALGQEGVDAEVIDLRAIAPMDLPTIRASVERTGAIVTVEEQPVNQGWGNALIASMVEAGVHLRRAPRRIGLPEYPVPYSPVLEDAAIPSAAQIASTVADVLKRR